MAAPLGNSIEGVLALLSESDDTLKAYALEQINGTVHHFWHQASGSLATIEALYEDNEFSHRELAALVASKIFYYLGELKEAQAYALGAGSLFDLAGSREDYARTVLDSCLDTYIEARRSAVASGEISLDDVEGTLANGEPKEPESLDQRLCLIVQRLLDTCIAEGQLEQAVGVALEARRLDTLVTAAEAAESNPSALLAHVVDVIQRTIPERAYRERGMRATVALYARLAPADASARARALALLADGEGLADLVDELIRRGGDAKLLALHIAFDLVDAQLHQLAARVAEKLKALEAKLLDDQTIDDDGGAATIPTPVDSLTTPLLEQQQDTRATTTTSNSVSPPTMYSSVLSVLSGRPTIELERNFLASKCHADLQILRNIKAGIESRNSVCHAAAVWTNSMMHAGTGVDAFLRSNLDWLAKAANWAKFGATAGLGVIQRGNIAEGRARVLMSPYLPNAPGGATGSPYSEGGALFALGLIHANQGQDIVPFLTESLRGASAEPVQHGACLGLGVAALGTGSAETFEDVKNVLYTDSAVAGEAAAYSLGLLSAGTGSGDRIAEMMAYARDTQHEKIVRGLGIGVAIAHYGREEDADGAIEAMARDQDSTLRYAAQFAIGLAYRGTRNNAAIQKLLHYAVTDVSNDVRRAAVLNLGFLLVSAPEQCPRLVALLANSYNPHVRYGAAMAVGIACAGSGSKEAVALLEPMLNDVTDFVQQGVLIAMALVLMEQPASRTETLRARIDKMHGNKGVEIMVRMGAIMAAGILDAGGRNATVALQSRTGVFRRTSVIGLALFAQYWYWHPLAYCLSMSLTPSAIIGVDASLEMPCEFSVISKCKPSTFAYPPPVTAEDKKSRDKAPTAVLSTTARVKARAASKKEKAAAQQAAMDTTESEGVHAEPENEKNKAEAEEEPNSYTICNPARVVPSQRRFIAFDPEQRWRPIKAVLSGVVVLRDMKPEEGEPEYLFQESQQQQQRGAPSSSGTQQQQGAANDERREPAPPAPFEYIPS